MRYPVILNFTHESLYHLRLRINYNLSNQTGNDKDHVGDID